MFLSERKARFSLYWRNRAIGMANQGLNAGDTLWRIFTLEPLQVRADVQQSSGWGWRGARRIYGVMRTKSLSVTRTIGSNNFSLTPAASDSNGRFSIKLRQPGSVV